MSVLSEVNQLSPSTVEVRYGDCRLLPAPLIDFNVEPQFNDAGVRQSNTTRLVLNGTILILPSGSYEQMYVKQEELRTAFSVDNLDFVILAADGNKTLPEGTVICSGIQPRVKSLNIEPDVHVTRFDYTIELEDSIAASGVSGVTSSFNNQWSFREDQDTCTLLVTHNVSAEGVEGEPDAFDNAIRAVKAELGIDKLPIQLPCFTEPNASGGFFFTHPSNPDGGPIFEVSVQREETADISNGSYSVTEVFRIVSGVPFYFTSRNDSFSTGSDGVSTVTIDGTVQGLGRTLVANEPIGAQGFERASSGFINHVRPQIQWDASGIYSKYKLNNTGSGLILNNPQATSISQNRCRGEITFSFTFTDDRSANVPSGIISLTTDVQRSDAIRLFASHPIPFRRLGNLLQDIQTTVPGTITINAQAKAENTGDPIADVNRAIVAIQNEINRLRMIHANTNSFQTLRISSLQNQSSDVDLTANVNVAYEFTVDLAAVQSADSDISLPTW
jgi:hypothetical protein